MRDYLTAARLFEPLAAEQPRNVSVRLLLGRANYHSAQLRRAEAEFRAVTELDPAENYAWFGLGRSLERQRADGQALSASGWPRRCGRRPTTPTRWHGKRKEEKAPARETGDC